MRSRTIFIWALINFTLTAAIGLALRLFSVGLITGIHYKNWLHAHSHIAFLGWIYPAIIAFLMDYLPDDLQRKDRVIKIPLLVDAMCRLWLTRHFPAIRIQLAFNRSPLHPHDCLYLDCFSYHQKNAA